MIIERNQVYKMDCLLGIKEMLRGGASRLYNHRPTLPDKL